MVKKYIYKNAIIYIHNTQAINIKKATEQFLKKVIEEKVRNGNNNSTRTINKEQVLD